MKNLSTKLVEYAVEKVKPIGPWVHIQNVLEAIAEIGSDDEAIAALLLLQRLKEE